MFRNQLIPQFDALTQNVRTVLSYSAPLVVVGLGYFIAARADRLMLGWLGNTSDVGLYTAASSLAMAMTLVLRSLGQIFMPVASSAYQRGDDQQLKQAYELVARWSVVAGGFAYLIFLAFGGSFLGLFGADYTGQEAYWALVIITSMYLVACGVGPTGAFLQMTNAHRIEAVNTVLFVIANIVLNYLAIPIWGLWGAAFATALAGVLRNGLQVAQIIRLSSINPIKPFPTIIILVFGGLAGLTIYIGYKSPWIIVLSLVFAVGLIVVSLATITRSELKLFVTVRNSLY